ncbi:MAG: hypothetical protein FGM32_03030 [Candidatus Kapabacteria bacterium]|nr:hypothetical protein [Candidatus Kapabacteria bacterium]
MTQNLALLAILSSFLYGCAGIGQQQQTSKLTPERISVTVYTDSASSTDFVIRRASGDTLLGSSQQVSLLLVQADETIAKMPMEFTSMGAPGRSETVTTTMTVRTQTMALPKYDSMVVEVVKNGVIQRYGVVQSRLQVTTRTLTLQPNGPVAADTSALQLLTSYSQDGKQYTFTATAHRRRQVPGEYFPSSEQLRIRIINGKGAVVWSSSEGLAFLTMIYPVEPSGVGEMHEYSLTWNGVQSDGTPLPAGLYTVEYTLPVKPLAYSTSVTGEFPLE